jgi:hypothetical protein
MLMHFKTYVLFKIRVFKTVLTPVFIEIFDLQKVKKEQPQHKHFLLEAQHIFIK